MSGELGVAQFRGTEVDRRMSFYFYQALNEALEQERAQLTEAKTITPDSMLKFGVASKFMGTMGAKYPAKPVHLVELAQDVARINDLMYFVVLDEHGVPDQDDPNGYALIKPYLDRLYEKYGVMLFRSYREPTIRKWMKAPEEQVREQRDDALSRLLREANRRDDGEESPE